MGKMKIYNTDCFEILKTIPDNSIDLIVTDPPYDISVTNGGGTINNIKKLNKSLADLKNNTDITQGYNIKLLGQEVLRLQKNINVYFWCNKKQISEYFDFYVNEHKCKFDIICWHKSNALPTYSNKYLSDTEYCLHFYKGKGTTFPQSYEDAKTYYIAPINIIDKKKYNHPTVKPLEIIERLVRNSSKENDVVLDMFMGSGTTGVACINTNRNFIGIELDENYFKTAEQRLQETVKERKEKNISNQT